MPPFDPQKATPEIVEEVQTAMNKAAAAKKIASPKVENGGYNEDDVFGQTQEYGAPVAYLSAEGGSGDEEAPASYDPKTGDYYVCAKFTVEAKQFTPEEQAYEEGKGFAGVSGFGGALAGSQSSANEKGYITAYNMHTGEIAWQVVWPHYCYSGITTTAGGLLFVGTMEGELQAYNAATGQKLWAFETGAGIGAPLSVYEFEGRERVSQYAGGNEFGYEDTRGDNLWQFSLKGTGPGPIEFGKTPPAPEKLP